MVEETEEIDSWGTEELTCPHCGEVQGCPDSDLEENDGCLECCECEKSFKYTREWSPTYYTKKLSN